MYCTNCGTKLPDQAAFCPECGARQSATVDQTPVSAAQVDTTPAYYDSDALAAQAIPPKAPPQPTIPTSAEVPASTGKLTARALLLAAAGAASVAILGGVAWGVIANLIGHELGYVAIALGALEGFAVTGLSGRRGPALQAFAITGTMVGIVIARFAMFYPLLVELVELNYGAEIAGTLSPASSEAWMFFLDNVTRIFSALDLLWLAIAVCAAWIIARRPRTQRDL